MEANFWKQKWEKNEIAFHESKANPLLLKYFKELSSARGSRIFIPLCGKTLDIGWLLSNGYCVAGAELSEIAVQQLFMDLVIEPKISVVDHVHHYSAENIDIFVGDIFNVTGEMLGSIDAIYDRAALVALPEEMRNRYSAHLMKITGKAPQLLICYEYDQSLTDGPPFSISDAEVRRQYDRDYDLALIESADVSGGLRGKFPAKEKVWLLQRK